MSEQQPTAGRVKNKAPAPIQITAEQLLREATDRLAGDTDSTKKAVLDKENTYEFKLKKRQQYEDIIRHNRDRIGAWIQYARFEEGLGEWDRARSVYERSLDVDPRNASLWLKYAEMEMRLGNPNLARNIWDRAVTILPRMDQFWYKYAYMEERLGSVEAARAVWERWMRWEPAEAIWYTFIKFEKRQKEFGRARRIFERMLILHPSSAGWSRWATFEEEEAKDVGAARAVWERALDALEEDKREPSLFIEFARFEVRQGEIERARAIYRAALSLFPKSAAEGLYHSYAAFEKQHGTPETIQDVVLTKRRAAYEAQLAASPHDYDAWLAYARLEETAGGDPDTVRDVYERGIAQVPPVLEKRFWRRYIYLWLHYALYEEAVAGDMERTAAVYRTALSLIPHATFTFAKLWLAFARFHVRRHDLPAARRLLGQALGRCPKSRIFTGYIEMEMQLREFDRVRVLYGKFLEWAPERASTWCKYAELEALLGDEDRARAIFELAIDEQGAIQIDMPELIWKAYIDWEYEEGRPDQARTIYERLLERTDHIKVWVSYATFEATCAAGQQEGMERARGVLERASTHFRSTGATAERLLLFEAWRELEALHGTPDSLAALSARLPKRVLKRRKLLGPDGSSGWEEYHDYVFPDDPTQALGIAGILAKAREWKQQQN